MAFFSLVVLVGPLAAHAAPQETEAVSKSDAGKAGSSQVDFPLQPQDVIRVQVFQEPDLTLEVRISQEATVNLPLIGTIDLKGKTTLQAAEMIRQLYDRDYLVKPQITVTVVDYAKRTVNVVGQVNAPGVVEFPHEKGLTLVEAISHANGPTRLAKLSKVSLKRTKPDGTTETFTIDVEELMSGKSNEAWPLQPGDVIIVPERSI